MAIHTADRPAQVPSNNNEFWTPLRKGVAIGAATMSLLGIGAKVGYDAIASPKPVETSQDTDSPAATTYAPADLNHDGSITELERIQTDGVVTKSELDALSDPTQTEAVDPSDLVAAYADDFDSWRQETRNILDKKGWLNAEQKAILELMPTVSIPKENWPDQMIANAISLDIADSMIQNPQELGIKMLPTVLDPGAPSFDETRSDIGKYVTVNILKTGISVKPQNGEFMGITGLTPNARAITADYVRKESASGSVDHSQIITLVDLQESADGASQSWRELGSWDANDPSVRTAFQELAA